VTLGRAMPELARAPSGRHDGPALGARRDVAEAAQRMRELIALEAERHGRHRGVGDRGESGGGERRERTKQLAARPGRGRQHDRVDQFAATVGEVEHIAAAAGTLAASGAAPGDRPHGHALMHAPGRQARDERVAEVGETGAERVEVRRGSR